MAGAAMLDHLQLGDHICAFVNGTDDGLDLMARAVTAGLDAGEKVLVFTEPLPPAAALAGLEARGVAVAPAQRAGQVRALPSHEAYQPDGRFEPARMLDSLTGYIEQAAADGYPGLRLVGDMPWALGEPAVVDRLVAYEAQVNRLFMEGCAVGICLYDLRAFGRGLLQEVACAHPTTLTANAEPEAVPLLRIRRTSDPYGLRLIGEADLSNEAALAAALDAVLDQRPDPAAPIVIDVEGLRFADANTAALLVRLALRAPGGVHVSGCHATVARAMDRLGVTQLSQLRLTGLVA
ncbi:MEDS domain-containing protein [Actinoplanes sp. NPDC051346]|uniref:MEDS domain-containing protein n=1 Tax=Actinoplanes sp. NPDC051346 TaxID=3155048 RepID=UPI00343C1FBD